MTEQTARPAARRYLFTCAQNDTGIHEGFWENLCALATYYDAQIHVSRFAYVKYSLGSAGDKFNFAPTGKRQREDMKWDARLQPFFSDARMKVAEGLEWCGEMNTLPTAVDPLSGLESYTGRNSSVFPHAKIAMASVATSGEKPAKFIYTTGAVTVPNYIRKKAGLKAEFHHSLGALLVEIDDDGNWFCRQIIGGEDGSICDLDIQVQGAQVTVGHRVAAIVWGDIHVAMLDQQVDWASCDMLARLKPRYQFLHDVLDFRAKNHHELKDPHRQYQLYCRGEANVAREVDDVRVFLRARSDALESGLTVVVDSNHHHHLARWLKEQNGLLDPENARFWLWLNQQVLDEITIGRKYSALQLACGTQGCQWLMEDESFLVKGIECGMHGDQGPNGARGSRNNFAKLGRKAVIAHSHEAGIKDGIYQVGTSSVLRPVYVHGPNAASHTHCVIYENGKRSLITMWKGKWRA